jgi:hypothetical protein
MTVEEYWAVVRRLGLRVTGIPGVYVTSRGDYYSVLDPKDRTPEQRVEMIEKLKVLMGIAPPSGRFDA